MESIVEQILNILKEAKKDFVREDFPSGCSMIDVLNHNGSTVVVQVELDRIGISISNDEVIDFTTIADKYFYDFSKAKAYLKNLLVP